MDKVNLAEGFSRISEHWRPRVAAEENGQEVKLVKFQGPFIWHRHEAEDELSLVVPRGSSTAPWRIRRSR
jgi:hypothetical protein